MSHRITIFLDDSEFNELEFLANSCGSTVRDLVKFSTTLFILTAKNGKLKLYYDGKNDENMKKYAKLLIDGTQ